MGDDDPVTAAAAANAQISSWIAGEIERAATTSVEVRRTPEVVRAELALRLAHVRPSVTGDPV